MNDDVLKLTDDEYIQILVALRDRIRSLNSLIIDGDNALDEEIRRYRDDSKHALKIMRAQAIRAQSNSLKSERALELAEQFYKDN